MGSNYSINCHQFIQKLLHNYIPKIVYYEFYSIFYYAKELACVKEVKTDEYHNLPFS